MLLDRLGHHLSERSCCTTLRVLPQPWAGRPLLLIARPVQLISPAQAACLPSAHQGRSLALSPGLNTATSPSPLIGCIPRATGAGPGSPVSVSLSAVV
jgi:hypothetical protein